MKTGELTGEHGCVDQGGTCKVWENSELRVWRRQARCVRELLRREMEKREKTRVGGTGTAAWYKH